jgi:hypothetical protein
MSSRFGYVLRNHHRFGIGVIEVLDPTVIDGLECIGDKLSFSDIPQLLAQSEIKKSQGKPPVSTPDALHRFREHPR